MYAIVCLYSFVYSYIFWCTDAHYQVQPIHLIVAERQIYPCPQLHSRDTWADGHWMLFHKSLGKGQISWYREATDPDKFRGASTVLGAHFLSTDDQGIPIFGCTIC